MHSNGNLPLPLPLDDRCVHSLTLEILDISHPCDKWSYDVSCRFSNIKKSIFNVCLFV